MNQVDSFTVDPAHNGATLSPPGNISVFNTVKPARCLWILDSGATDHVCTSLSDFTSYKSIPPVLISLPNGHRVFTKFYGDAIFNNKFFLTDVLYVPEFTFNIVSASKLSTNLKCHLIFSSTNCVIQDNQTKERIGIVKAKDDLYVFQSSAFQNTVTNNVIPSFHCTVKYINLWHYRSGHPSDERLRVLRSLYPFIYDKRMPVCGTCHRAKHKKLPFAFSKSCTASIFYILHMDIWGPCSVASMHGFRYFLTIADDFFPIYLDYSYAYKI